MRHVGVIGLGYVGLPLAVAFAREGCEVIARRRRLRARSRRSAAGRSYIEDVSDEELRAVAERLQRDHPLRASWPRPTRC